MNNILNYMDTLNEIDTDDVKELYNVNDMNNSLRDDTFDSPLDKKVKFDMMFFCRRLSINSKGHAVLAGLGGPSNPS